MKPKITTTADRDVFIVLINYYHHKVTKNIVDTITKQIPVILKKLSNYIRKDLTGFDWEFKL